MIVFLVLTDLSRLIAWRAECRAPSRSHPAVSNRGASTHPIQRRGFELLDDCVLRRPEH